MLTKKTIINKMFHPEKYGMIFCPDCNGSGRAINNGNGVNPCKVCGGFGLIKKEERDSDVLQVAQGN
jgi:DnaJ-class molecular chaperone